MLACLSCAASPTRLGSAARGGAPSFNPARPLLFRALIRSYTDPRMRPLDRSVGNTLEWMPVFIGLLWLATALGADVITLGWA